MISPDPTPTDSQQTVSTDEAHLHDGKWWSLHLNVVNYSETDGSKRLIGYVSASHLPEGNLSNVAVHALDDQKKVLASYPIGVIDNNQDRYRINRTLPEETHYVIPRVGDANLPSDYNGSVRGWIIPEDGVPGEYDTANGSMFMLDN